MKRPLSQTEPFKPRQRTLAMGSLEAMRLANRAVEFNLSVAAPLTKRQDAAGVQVGIDTKGWALPDGSKGEILYHDGDAWVPLAVPGVDSVLAFDIATGLPYWLATTDDCPTTTTTTVAPTTTTTAAPTTTSTAAPTTTTAAPTTSTAAPTTTTAAPTTTTAAPTTTTAAPTTTTAAPTTTTPAPTTTTAAPTTTTVATTTTTAEATTTTAEPTTTTCAANSGADECCCDDIIIAVCGICDATCGIIGSTVIRACSAGEEGTCAAKTGNCSYIRIADPQQDCDPDCRYQWTGSDCCPFDMET